MILECIDRFRSEVRQFVMSGWSESQTHLILHISYDGHNDNDCRLQHREQSQPSSVQQHIILLCAKPAEKKKHFFSNEKSIRIYFSQIQGGKTGIKNNTGHDKHNKIFFTALSVPEPYSLQCLQYTS